MLKKAVITGLGAALLVGFLFGRDAASYLQTTCSAVTNGVKESVPVDFEIDRARKMITSLDPEIRKNMHVIAKEEVEVDRIRRQVDQLEGRLDNDRADLMRLKSDLETGQSHFVYASRRYSANQVKIDLASRLNRVKTNDETLLNLTKVLHARERGLTAARQKLEEMLAAKRQLIVDVENLEARQKMVEVAQTTSDFNFDDSRLARTKELITDIQTRIEVAERLVNVEGDFRDEIPLDEAYEFEADIVDQVTEYLGLEPQVEVVAEATDFSVTPISLD